MKIMLEMEGVNSRKVFRLAIAKIAIKDFFKKLPNVTKIILYNRRSVTKRKIKCSHGQVTDSLAMYLSRNIILIKSNKIQFSKVKGKGFKSTAFLDLKICVHKQQEGLLCTILFLHFFYCLLVKGHQVKTMRYSKYIDLLIEL